MIVAKKNQFLLYNTVDTNKKIFNLIVKNIPNSIFSKLEFYFFNKILRKRLINVYYLKKGKKIASIITTTTFNNYNFIKKEILIHLLFHPLIIITNLSFFFNLLKRDSNEIDFNNQNKYLHLLHLVIIKEHFMGITISAKDNIINFFFKEIIKKNNANYFYLCYERNNYKAHKFYKRNKFVIYKKNQKIFFIKKKVL